MKPLRLVEEGSARGCRRAEGRTQRGYALLEVLVYIGIVMMLLGIGYLAMYRCIDNSTAMRRGADDVAKALHLGERWRADIRAATGPVRLDDELGKQVLHIVGPRGETAYEFSENALFRRVGDGPRVRLMDHIQGSAMTADHRQRVVVWRWELELLPRSKASAKASRMRPLFTFLAVPGNGTPSGVSVYDKSLSSEVTLNR